MSSAAEAIEPAAAAWVAEDPRAAAASPSAAEGVGVPGAATAAPDAAQGAAQGADAGAGAVAGAVPPPGPAAALRGAADASPPAQAAAAPGAPAAERPAPARAGPAPAAEGQAPAPAPTPRAWRLHFAARLAAVRPERDDQAAPPSAYPDFGKYPEYVKRNFRVKALGLAAMQLLIVLCIMALVTSLGLERTWDTFAALLAMIMALVLAMTLLAMFKVDYPKNYILLLFVTVLAGLVWGTGGAMLPERMHFQIVGSMFVTMAFSCVFVQALAEAFKHRPRELVVASLFGAWAVSVVAIVATTGLLGVHVVHMMCSIAISFGLMVLFMLQGGYLLIECDPDTFMAFVVAMDSTLLAIVALPVLWACGLTLCVFCFLGETTEVEEEAAAAENAPADDPAFYHPDLHVV